MRMSVRSRLLLADELVPRRERDQMGEAFQRDGVAVVDERLDRFAERRHRQSSRQSIARLRIFPVGVFGRASTNTTMRGYLYAATRSFAHS